MTPTHTHTRPPPYHPHPHLHPHPPTHTHTHTYTHIFLFSLTKLEGEAFLSWDRVNPYLCPSSSVSAAPSLLIRVACSPPLSPSPLHHPLPPPPPPTITPLLAPLHLSHSIPCPYLLSPHLFLHSIVFVFIPYSTASLLLSLVSLFHAF